MSRMTKGKPVSTDGDDMEPAARRLRRELLGEQFLDDLMARADAEGVRLTGECGLLPEMVKAVLEPGLDAELTDHLGYERGDPAGRGSPNSRNGTTHRPTQRSS